MIRLSPDQLARAAQEERDRRAAASRAAVQAGTVSADRVAQDDIIWSNIVHACRRMAGAGGPPHYHTPIEYRTMAASARATYRRACDELEQRPALIDKVIALRDIAYALEFTLLYQMDRPWLAREAA